MFNKSFGWVLIATLLIVVQLSAAGCGKKEEGKLQLYVAAGLKKPMDVVIEDFKKEKGVEVIPNYGPSGGLYGQIKEGQPCDLFFSADWLYIDKLQNDQKLVEGKKFLKDNIVLVVSNKGSSKVKSINDLTKEGIVLAVPDPSAPAGAYAENALKNLGIWEKINASGNLKARPSTVNQVAIMVKNDEVDAGLIFSSVADIYGLKETEVLPENLTGEIIFATGIIKGGNEKLAREFRDFAVKHIDEFVKYGWKPYE